MSANDWLQRTQSGGMSPPDIFPLDPHDTEVGPHVLRSFAEFADASDDPRCVALAEYVQHMNTYEQTHILNLCTAIDTQQSTGLKGRSRRRMGAGRIAGTLEEFNDAIEALTAARDRIYPAAK